MSINPHRCSLKTGVQVKSRKNMKGKLVGVSNCTPEGKNAFKLGFIQDNLSHLLGEILTVIDASLDGDKNKAVKDLLRDKFSHKQNWFSECAWKDLPQGDAREFGSNIKASDDWYSGLVKLKE